MWMVWHITPVRSIETKPTSRNKDVRWALRGKLPPWIWGLKIRSRSLCSWALIYLDKIVANETMASWLETVTCGTDIISCSLAFFRALFGCFVVQMEVIICLKPHFRVAQDHNPILFLPWIKRNVARSIQFCIPTLVLFRIKGPAWVESRRNVFLTVVRGHSTLMKVLFWLAFSVMCEFFVVMREGSFSFVVHSSLPLCLSLMPPILFWSPQLSRRNIIFSQHDVTIKIRLALLCRGR